MKYLYIFECGVIRQSERPPGEHDFKAFREGVLEILVVDDKSIKRYVTIENTVEVLEANYCSKLGYHF